MYAVQVKMIGGWTIHSLWATRKTAKDQADYLRGSRVIKIS